MKATETNLPAIIERVAASVAGRFILFTLSVALSSELGILLGSKAFVSPWNSLFYFVGAGLLSPTGWAFVVYPAIVVGLIVYLWKERLHVMLLAPVLFVTPWMRLLAGEMGG